MEIKYVYEINKKDNTVISDPTVTLTKNADIDKYGY